MYKEKRTLPIDNLRACCIRNNYYDCGTNAAYEELFNMVEMMNYRGFDLEDYGVVAFNIVEHSSSYDDNSELENHITNVMSELIRVSVSRVTYVELV